jgi:hypothetical protein
MTSDRPGTTADNNQSYAGLASLVEKSTAGRFSTLPALLGPLSPLRLHRLVKKLITSSIAAWLARSMSTSPNTFSTPSASRLTDRFGVAAQGVFGAGNAVPQHCPFIHNDPVYESSILTVEVRNIEQVQNPGRPRPRPKPLPACAAVSKPSWTGHGFAATVPAIICCVAGSSRHDPAEAH